MQSRVLLHRLGRAEQGPVFPGAVAGAGQPRQQQQRATHPHPHAGFLLRVREKASRCLLHRSDQSAELWAVKS